MTLKFSISLSLSCCSLQTCLAFSCHWVGGGRFHGSRSRSDIARLPQAKTNASIALERSAGHPVRHLALMQLICHSKWKTAAATRSPWKRPSLPPVANPHRRATILGRYSTVFVLRCSCKAMLSLPQTYNNGLFVARSSPRAGSPQVWFVRSTLSHCS
jgi:hypothetical protein